MANVQWLKQNSEDINKRASVYDILNASYDTSVSASMRLSTVYSCIRVISESMGTLPLRVYKLKLQQHPYIQQLLNDNHLPLTHYYIMYDKPTYTDTEWTAELWCELKQNKL